MTDDPVTRFGNDFLRSDLKAWNTRERSATAGLLIRIAEFDRRRLYREDGFDSMVAWCITELNMGDYTAYAYVRAARTARRFPAILPMLAQARLNVTAVRLLRRHLTTGNARELLELAAGQSKSAIASLLARRYPRSESLPLVVRSIATTEPIGQELSLDSIPDIRPGEPCAVANGGQMTAPIFSAPPAVRSSSQPIAADRYDVRFSMSQEMQDDLSLAIDLSADEVPSGDLAGVLHLALKAYIRDKQKRKFAATDRPREPRRVAKTGSRHVPAHVRRAVARRDGERCTFVGNGGHRCEARRHLEFDHVVPLARGGQSTVANVRLRCRAHNQLEAERAFGAEFMRHRREHAAEQRASSGTG